MFGMLDSRAHKLYWRLTFPFRLTNWVILFAAIPVGIIVARSTPYVWWAKIMIAYLEHVPPQLNQGDSRGAEDGRGYRH